MATGRPGPAALECAMDIWGVRGKVTPVAPLPPRRAADRRRRGAQGGQAARRGEARSDRRAAAARRTRRAEVTQTLRHAAGAGAVLPARPRRARAIAVRSASTCRSAATCGARPMRCSAIGTKLNPMTAWGIDKKLHVVRVDADPEEPARYRKPAVALIGDAAAGPSQADRCAARSTNIKRASRHDGDAGAAGSDAQAAGQARAAARVSGSDPRRTAGGRHFCR